LCSTIYCTTKRLIGSKNRLIVGLVEIVGKHPVVGVFVGCKPMQDTFHSSME